MWGLRTSLGCAIPSQYSGVRCIIFCLVSAAFDIACAWHIWHIWQHETAESTWFSSSTYVPWPCCCLQVIRIWVSCYWSALEARHKQHFSHLFEAHLGAKQHFEIEYIQSSKGSRWFLQFATTVNSPWTIVVDFADIKGWHSCSWTFIPLVFLRLAVPWVSAAPCPLPPYLHTGIPWKCQRSMERTRSAWRLCSKMLRQKCCHGCRRWKLYQPWQLWEPVEWKRQWYEAKGGVFFSNYSLLKGLKGESSGHFWMSLIASERLRRWAKQQRFNGWCSVHRYSRGVGSFCHVELLRELKELCFGVQVPEFFERRSTASKEFRNSCSHGADSKAPHPLRKVAFLDVAKIARRQSGEQKTTLKIPQHWR